MESKSTFFERLGKKVREQAVDQTPFTYARTATILEFTNMVLTLMHERGISRAELARRLEKDPGFVTRVLKGKNVTLSTAADVLAVLGRQLYFDHRSFSEEFDTEFEAPSGSFEWVPATNAELLESIVAETELCQKQSKGDACEFNAESSRQGHSWDVVKVCLER